jgi:hypothetical protein
MAYDRQDVSKLSLDELKTFIPTKNKELVAIAGENGEKIKSLDPPGVEDFQARNTELREANVRFASLRDAAKAYEDSQKAFNAEFKTPNRKVTFASGREAKAGSEEEYGGEDESLNQFKSLGELFTESEQYKSVHEKGMPNGNLIKGAWNPEVDGNLSADVGNVSVKSLDMAALKATMMTTAGWPPYPTLGPRPPVLTAVQQPVVADLIPQDDTTQPSILYYEEDTFVENADWVAEGGTKPEAQLGLVLRTQPVVKVAVTLPISEEQIMDVPQVRGYIDGRLTLMVKRKEEQGLLNGNGVPPQLRGFHNVVGIGSITRGALEDNPDAILRAITDVNNIQGFANVSGIIMNPLQWLAIRLLRTKTGDYIWGHPALVGPATLWGLPVIATNAETAGRALVGDFVGYSHISRRLGIRIDVGYIDKDFVNDIQRIRLEERLSLEVYRAKAFEEVLGLNAAPTA